MSKKPLSDNQLIKNALRRAFARSQTHREIIQETIVVGHTDPERPRVKTWSRCPSCLKLDAKSYMQVDHLEPVQPLGVMIDEMDRYEIMDRIFCLKTNLKATCKECHHMKSQAENAQRRKLKKEKKK